MKGENMIEEKTTYNDYQVVVDGKVKTLTVKKIVSESANINGCYYPSTVKRILFAVDGKKYEADDEVEVTVYRDRLMLQNSHTVQYVKRVDKNDKVAKEVSRLLSMTSQEIADEYEKDITVSQNLRHSYIYMWRF